MKGLITSLQRMSIHDGPGIRTVVFMKGCNMACKWCHNPETWSLKPQVQYIRERCIHCLTCLQVCPRRAIEAGTDSIVIDRSKCDCCGICALACCSNALSMIGREVSPEQLWEEVSKDNPYFVQSHGGVTVSGGEPMMQLHFLKDFLSICKSNGIHTAIESNLSFPWPSIEGLLSLTDLWMCDLKHADDGKHRKWTGIGNATIIENIGKLADSGADLIVRTPVIPGVNDSAEDIEAICRILSPYKEKLRYTLLGFHTLGFGKYDSLGMCNELRDTEPLKPEALEELKKIVAKWTSY